MKKNFKLVLALVLSVMMIVGNMAAIADLGDLVSDSSISITGLDTGDTVNVYKIVEWVDGVGWKLVAPFTSLTSIESKLNDGSALDATDVANLASAATGTAKYSKTLTATDNGTFTQASPEAGMYIALVKPATAGTVYNPIIVSADFTEGGSNTIDSSETIIGTAITKKKPVTLEKTEPKITNDVGDLYEFTITTTIPVYSSAFTNQFFTLTDNLSEHLDLKADTIRINNQTVANFFSEKTSGTDYAVTTNTHDFTIEFKHPYVSALSAAQDLTITYKAELNCPVSDLTNVTEEENKVYVKFPNNPNDLTGKDITVLRDGTKEYTFTIDGSLFGDKDWQTGELVKIGVDKDGNPIESVINIDNGSSHAALKGAKFGVYTDQTSAQNEVTTLATFNADGSVATNGLYTNKVFNGYVTTDERGLMKIEGLDVGTYYIKELDAPNGYIRDTSVHYFTISAEYYTDDSVTATEYYTVDNNGIVTWYDEPGTGRTAYTYPVQHVLKSYTVTVDNVKSSTYTWTNQGPSISTVTPAESSTDIANTKGVELPSTGGIGTTIFYVGGSLLVLAAAILLITKRRMSSND